MLEIDVIQVAMLMVLTMGAMFFLIEWRRSRREDQEFKKEELELRKYEIQSNSDSARFGARNNNSAPEESKTDLNGYVFMSVDEGKKSTFSEMLKGFEEYAKLKGYQASLSVETSVKDKIGFKFTLHEEGVSVSAHKVKSDINEYINIVMSGGNFDDMPVLITPEEHSAVIGTLKARLKYMEYKSLISKMTNSAINHSPTNIKLIQEGIGMDSRSYSANNSANVVQGDESKNAIEHSNIQIGKNVAEINSQVDDLNKIIQAIEKEALINQELKPAVRYLENTKEELEESGTPDGASISKWLDKTNSILNTAKASAETITKFGGLLKVFGVSL
jgi:hypothetical protein